MKENPKVLMVVTTEFGLLTALLYYFLHQEKNLFPHFILLKNKKERFSRLNLDALPGTYDLYNDELNTRVHNPDVAFKASLCKKNVKEIVFQNPQNFITNIILNTYKINNQNIKLTMLSDGTLLLSKMSFKDKVITNVKLYYRKLINGCTNLPKYIYNYMDYVPLVDRLIAHSDVDAKEFIATSDLIKHLDDFRDQLNSIFCIEAGIYEDVQVIFFTQPILSNRFPREVKENYIKLLRNIALFMQNNNIQMLIKVHPEENVDLYKQFENDHVIVDSNKNVPSEIILQGLKNKVILSIFSSVSLNNHEKYLKHFWLYKLINYELKIKNSSSDIIVPSSLFELNHLIFEIHKTNSYNINKVGKIKWHTKNI